MERHMLRGFALAALLSVLAAPALLAQAQRQEQEHASSPPSRASQAPAPVPDHSVSGVVKFVDRTRLVITRAGKTPVEMTFSVNASTQKEGAIAAGAKVQVRFRGDAHAHAAVATAILAAPHTATVPDGPPRHKE
jgi:hypothetical protein